MQTDKQSQSPGKGVSKKGERKMREKRMDSQGADRGRSAAMDGEQGDDTKEKKTESSTKWQDRMTVTEFFQHKEVHVTSGRRIEILYNLPYCQKTILLNMYVKMLRVTTKRSVIFQLANQQRSEKGIQKSL